MNDRTRPQANRTILGILLALLFVAVLLALWFLIFDSDGGSSSASSDNRAFPTAVTIPTSTPDPLASAVVPAQAAAVATAVPTTVPAITPTPLPEGFSACTDSTGPLTTSTYVVDTNSTPLNQRTEPSVDADQVGTFAAGKADLVFTGQCVVNVADGYTWWQIFNGTDDVWVASDFVTPN